MTSSLRHLFIVLLTLLGLTTRVAAASFEIVPQIGYQMTAPMDLANPNDQMDIQNKSLIGLSIGYMNQENGQLELAWTRSDTNVKIDRADGLPSDQLGVRRDQLHLNGMYMFGPAPFQPFGLLGLGATRFEPSGNRTTETKFSFALGGGVKWLWNDHIGLRLEARWTPAIVLSGSDFFCDKQTGTGCYTTEANSYWSKVWPFLNSVEFISGLMLRY